MWMVFDSVLLVKELRTKIGVRLVVKRSSVREKAAN